MEVWNESKRAILRNNIFMRGSILIALMVCFNGIVVAQSPTAKLNRYIPYFNSIDSETVINHVSNKEALNWLRKLPMRG